MVKLTFYGHSAFGLEAEGTKILIDPYFTDNPQSPVCADQLAAEYIIVTHAHQDHIGDAQSIAERCGATIVANFEIATFFGAQGLEVSPMHIGGGVNFPFGRVKLTPAFHGSTYEVEGKPVTLGLPAGAVVSIGGKHIYHAGDTALFSDMRLIAEYRPLDAALLPIGDRFTMGVEDAVKAAQLLGAKITIPMHFNTWPLIEADPNDFVARCEAAGRDARIMKPGETMEVC